jgi:hypothetical protein
MEIPGAQNPIKPADISVQKDPNITTRPTIGFRRDTNVGSNQTIRFQDAFLENQYYSAGSIYEFTQKLMYNWFPIDNYTTLDISGSLTINGNDVGKVMFKVLSNVTVEPATPNIIFSDNKDITSSWLFVKGNMTINPAVTLTPPSRKLFTVLYVKGDLTFQGTDSIISMTQRGANHSGTGESGGATTAVDLQVSSNIKILGQGGAGAPGSNTVEQSARQGTNGVSTFWHGLYGVSTFSTLQTGGGGGGWWDFKTIT